MKKVEVILFSFICRNHNLLQWLLSKPQFRSFLAYHVSLHL
jgi:hypothetical protein